MISSPSSISAGFSLTPTHFNLRNEFNVGCYMITADIGRAQTRRCKPSSSARRSTASFSGFGCLSLAWTQAAIAMAISPIIRLLASRLRRRMRLYAYSGTELKNPG